MATTIPGGAYKDAAGAWHDANGKALTDEQIAAVKALIGESQPAAGRPKKAAPSGGEE